MRISSATDPLPPATSSNRNRAARGAGATAPRTRLVQTLKLVLPALALAVLASMFLFLRDAPVGPPASGSMPTQGAAEEGARMTVPSFAGVGRDGTQVLARAAVASLPLRNDAPTGAITAEVRLVPPSGHSVEAYAPALRLDPEAGLLVLSGGVHLVDNAGYDVRMERLEAATDGSTATAAGPVIAIGPQGRLAAGGFVVVRAATSPGYRTVFDKGVRLVYLPPDGPAGATPSSDAAPLTGGAATPKDAAP
jgi:lipopolysaccharide export system protein LptC